VRGQLSYPAALSPGKEAPVPIGQKTDCRYFYFRLFSCVRVCINLAPNKIERGGRYESQFQIRTNAWTLSSILNRQNGDQFNEDGMGGAYRMYKVMRNLKALRTGFI
jgi:hypothetical protein